MQNKLSPACLLGLMLLWTVALAPSLSAQNEEAGAVVEAPASTSPGTAAELPALRVIRISGVLATSYGIAKSSAAGSTASAGPQGVTFALYRDQEGGAPLWLETQNVQVDAQGRYSVLLGSTQPEGLPLALFSGGEARWLGVQAGSEPEQPRVLLVSVPYALKAADAETLGGQPLAAFVLRDLAGSEISDASGDGPRSFTKAAADITPSLFNGSGTANFIPKFLNADTLGNSQFFDNGINVGLGTTSPAVKLDVAGTVRATLFAGSGVGLTELPATSLTDGFTVQPNASSPNLIGGFSGNAVTAGAIGAVISGGGITGSTNRVTDHFGVVGGGVGNQAGDAAGTTADRVAATVGGGASNTAGGLGATVGGGVSNNGSGLLATVGGGFGNTASGAQATVGGGASNAAGGENATVPGGLSNVAAGAFSFAAGRRAQANHAGAFVWADSTDADFASTADDQFLIRAVRVGIGTTAPAAQLDVAGDVKITGTPGVEGIIFPDGSKQTEAATGGGPATDVNCATPCISTAEIVDAAVTGAKLAAGSVDSGAVADGTLVDADISASAAISPTKISGIAATLGSNSFVGTQNIAGGNLGVGTITPAQRLDVAGNVKITGTPGVEGIIFPDGSKQTEAATGGGGPATDVNCGVPCISTGEIVDAAVTAAKLAAGSVDSGTVADGTIVDADISAAAAISPSKIAGTVATLGANAFLGTQSITGGNLALPPTADASTGVLTLGGTPFLHSFGGDNTFVGPNAGNFAISGVQNTATGANALISTTTGNFNTASGTFALRLNTTGNQNTASGVQALFFNTTGNFNTASGTAALQSNTTGSDNTASGWSALFQNTTGFNNTALGVEAGVTGTPANANVSGSSNTFLGYQAGPGTPTQLTNATAIGANAMVSADNALVLGGTGADAVNVGIGVTAPTQRLDVAGDVKITGTPGVEGIIFPDGSKQTAAATGGGGPATDVACLSPCISTLEIVDAAVTAAKLAAGSVDSGTVADGTLVDADISASAAISPSKIAGTVATLGANIFLGTQSITAGNLALPPTADASTGVLTLGGNPFLHSFGLDNTFVGPNAGNFTTSGTGANTAIGSFALSSNTTGFSNIASGARALFANTTGFNNTGLGHEAGVTATPANANTTGFNNTFLGYQAGPGTTTPLFNATAIGANALVSASNALVLGGTGVSVGIGTDAPTARLHVAGNVRITGTPGVEGIIFPDGSKQTAAATGGGGPATDVNCGVPCISTVEIVDAAVTAAKLAAGSVDSGTVANETIVDADISPAAAISPTKISGIAATLGSNIFLGTQTITGGNLDLPPTADASTGALTQEGNRFLHSFGTDNTFVGPNAGNFITSGFGKNTAIGASALSSNTTGNNNTASGANALGFNTTGDFNTASGVNALQNTTTGNSNTASGRDALSFNTAGNNNTASGASALRSNTAGFNNTALGFEAGLSNVTGSNNTFLGYRAGPGITTLSNATAIGANALVSASNALVLGDSAVSVGIRTEAPLDVLQVVGDIRVGTSGTNGCIKGFGGTGLVGVCSSDARLKKNIQPLPPALAKVAGLRPVSYDWRAEEFPEYHFGDARTTGLIAQEVEQVFPEMVATDEWGYKAVDYTALRMLMLQAIRELKTENDTLREQLQSQEERLQKLETGVILSQHTRTVASR